uniref:Uncharacterized protein n=1 Tax=Nelumbo nucifera TaxID=4432 RepID=A0A822YHC2_NELNU|nr:TPA_asm: hypothetical protein HUJ06_030336 [Nelumbo nucifera]
MYSKLVLSLLTLSHFSLQNVAAHKLKLRYRLKKKMMVDKEGRRRRATLTIPFLSFTFLVQ